MKRELSSRFIVFLLAGVILLLPATACKSSRGCPPNPEPEIVIKEKPVPYPVLIKIKELPPLVLPEYPMHPGHDADDAELKSWALEVKRVEAQRETLYAARVKSLNLLIQRHNELETEPPPL